MTRNRTPARRARLALSAAVVLLAAGDAQAAVKRVTAGPPGARVPKGVPRLFEIEEFFPRAVTVRAGDSVQWRVRTGHTVTFPLRGQPAPSWLAIDGSTSIAGVSDPAAAPYWFNGQPQFVVDGRVGLPQGGPEEDGSRLTGSGLALGAPIAYALRFSRPGTFGYLCAVHPGMRGTVRVLPSGRPIPSARADRRAVRGQLAAAFRTLRAKARLKGPRGPVVQAGNDKGAVSVSEFLPSRRTVRVGEAVTFRVSPSSAELHTVTFGPPDYVSAVSAMRIRPVPGPFGPPAALALNPEFLLPSVFPIRPYDGTAHGNGFLNLGVLDDSPSTPGALAPRNRNLRFSRPGVYRFFCLVHRAMRGSIRVQP